MRPVRFVALVLALAASAQAQEEGVPLARTRLMLEDGRSPRVEFKGRWRVEDAQPSVDPTFAGATLRIAGSGPQDGDSGVIRLPGGMWSRVTGGRRTYRYEDPSRSRGGIRSVVLTLGRRRGTLAVTGGSATWPYAIAGKQETVSVTFIVGDARWCARFEGRSVRSRRGRVFARRKGAPESCPCDSFTSTFAAIQGAIFERRGCTAEVCHGSAAQGGLDLRPEVAFGNLVDADSPLGLMKRVEPGEPARSFLWRKLAKGTLGLADVPGTSMPNGLPPIPEAELDAIRAWIQAGAPEVGVVPDTEVLLGSCLPPPDPIKIRPPAPPAPGEGVQFYGPPWDIPAQGENEVCYAVYYDVSAHVPPSAEIACPDAWGGPDKRCFVYNRHELSQDPNSHHSIIHFYRGAFAVDDPAARFGPFTCRGGANHGLTCNPLGIGQPAPAGAECGPRSGCSGRVARALACIGYGPPDFGFDLTGAGGVNSPTLIISTETVLRTAYPAEVYSVLPVRGVLVFNSHAFNTTDQPTTNEQWFNLYFAPPDAQRYPLEGIFDGDDIFIQNVPPFESREYCRTYTAPQGSRIFQLSTHTHKRGKFFRVWGPPIAEECLFGVGACEPEPGQPLLVTVDYADPAVFTYNPPLPLDSPDPATRRFKYCAIYDNGAERPEDVKRQSTSPDAIFGIGGPCSDGAVTCLAGPQRGQLCNGDDRVCDSASGANDGVCDACPLRGGVTTEDEMFVLLGSLYQVP
jgi:hypothetical protein